jgi:hypothetical protein
VLLPAPQDAAFRLDGGRIERIDCETAALASEEARR